MNITTPRNNPSHRTFKPFGRRMREKRKEKGISLRAFCKEAALDPIYWSRIERELLPPPRDLKVIERVCAALGIEETAHIKIVHATALRDRGVIPQEVLLNGSVRPVLPFILSRLGTASDREVKAILEALGVVEDELIAI